MKKFFFLFLITGVLLVIGCSDNATGPTNSGGLGGTGGGGGGSVTFTMGTTQGSQQGNTMFTFKPSVDITITTVNIKLPAQQFEDPLTNPNPNEVYTSQNTYQIEEYTGVQSGQQWQFVFVGKLGSSTGAAYTKTVDWTIP
jgi:hypothetical protein